MKKYMRVIVLLVMALSLCACAGDRGVNEEPGISAPRYPQTADPPTPGAETEVSWRISHKKLSASYELATVSNSQVYGCFYTPTGLKVVVSEAGTGEEKGTFEIPGVTEIHSITVDAQDRICLFGSAGDDHTLWQIDSQGTVRTIGDIALEDMESIDSQKGFLADSDDHYYLWYGMLLPCTEVYEDGEPGVYTRLDRIYVMDRDMNVLCYEQVPDSMGNRLVSLLFDSEGIPMLLAKDPEGYYTRRVRTEDREPYAPSRLEGIDEQVMYDLETGGQLALTGEGLLYSKDGALRLCHLSAGETGRDERLLELAMGGVLPEDIIYLGMQGDAIEIIDNYRGGEVSEYTRFEPGEQEDQTRLTLGCLSLYQEMRNMIVAFNRSQDRIRIEPVIYVEGYDYDAGAERLKLDVIRGKAPDLIDVSGLDPEILAKTGAFLDLYEFMDRDSECGREKLMPSILRVHELEGRLYGIAPAFQLYSMWGGGSLVQGRSGVSMKELIDILRENGGDINSIYGFSADESVLRSLCSMSMGEYIDWEKGTCDFTGESFRELLDFAAQYQGPQYDRLYGAIREGKILLTLGPVGSVEDYRLQSELYGEKVQFIGYPTTEGAGAAAYFSGSEIAINSGTAHSEETWEFVKYYLLQGYEGLGFPILRERFEQVLKESQEEYLVKGEDGNPEVVCKISYIERENDVFIYVPCADRADADAVRALAESVTGKLHSYRVIQNIIDEEAESYFSGQKTLDEVTGIIQNRVQLYLNENIK